MHTSQIHRNRGGAKVSNRPSNQSDQTAVDGTGALESTPTRSRRRNDETLKMTYVNIPEQEGILVCDGDMVVDVIYGY